MGKGFSEKKRRKFSHEGAKARRYTKENAAMGRFPNYSDFHGCQMKVNVVAEDTNHGCNQTDRLTHSSGSTGVQKRLLVNFCVLRVLV